MSSEVPISLVPMGSLDPSLFWRNISGRKIVEGRRGHSTCPGVPGVDVVPRLWQELQP